MTRVWWLCVLLAGCSFKANVAGGPYPPCLPDGSCPDGCFCLAGKVCVPEVPGQGPEFCLGCPEGYADCDGNRENGCETNTETDEAHCGRCQNPCPRPGTICGQEGEVLEVVFECAGGGCVQKLTGTPQPCESQCNVQDPCFCDYGKCLRQSCGQTRCRHRAYCLQDDGVCYCGDPSSPTSCGWGQICCHGICTDIDDNNCTGCGQGCPSTRHCEPVEAGQGECFCDPGRGDCDSNPLDCETDVSSNPRCGACWNDCAEYGCIEENGYFFCDCPPGLQNCDLRVSGCETDVSQNPRCGACENDCTPYECIEDNGYFFCNCPSNLANCDFTTPGCETDITQNPDCGACGNDCRPGACLEEDGWYFCQCPRNLANCDFTTPGCETDITQKTDCGGCGNDCGDEPCVFDGKDYYCACPPGRENCFWHVPGCETNVTLDPNCGWCGNDCPPEQYCRRENDNGQCQDCDYLRGDCNNDGQDGCEIDVSVSGEHCGQCENRCLKGDCRGGLCGDPGVFCVHPYPHCPAGDVCCFQSATSAESRCSNTTTSECVGLDVMINCDDRQDCQGRFCCAYLQPSGTLMGTFCKESTCEGNGIFTVCASRADCRHDEVCVETIFTEWGRAVTLRVCKLP